MQFNRSTWFAVALHLLVPGLGHIYWREYLFGAFTLLITLIGVMVVVVSLFVDIGSIARIVLLALPLLFYLFTFMDLVRTVRLRRIKTPILPSRAWIVLSIGVLYQLAAPTAVVNFGIVNHPEIFVMEDNSLNPLYSTGDLLKANRLAYTTRTYLLSKPIWHSIPERYDVVRFAIDSVRYRTGLVIGLPDEMVEIVDGVPVVNGYPELAEVPGGLYMSGDWPLTSADGYSILIATLNLGSIDKVHRVHLTAVMGKVSRLF